MIPLTLAEIAEATGGRLSHADPSARVTGSVEFDSRKITPGGLFIAFAGEHVDGHDFAAGAMRAGAVAVLATRDPGSEASAAPIPAILVPDPLAALGTLARLVVDRLPNLTVVGLTGSSGKTTTKDFIAQLAGWLGPTVAPPGSFNNELGHPYTALQADEDTRVLVLEMGARGPGHVRYLTGIAPPRIGLVLNVGSAHLGEFGSVEAIASAKGELIEALPADGVAVLNADDPLVRAMAARTSARVVLFGEAPDADFRARDVTLDDRGRPSYTLVTAGGEHQVRLALTGRHQVSNTLAAAAVVRELGLSGASLTEALGQLRLISARRMDVFDRGDGVTVIDDSYNANPASTSAALRALAALGGGRRRTVAVLGLMAELGAFEREAHERVGQLAAQLGVDQLVVLDEAAAIHDGARTEARWKGESVLVPDQQAAIATLGGALRSGDVVLVKGSRYRTWEVADALRAELAGGRAAEGATG